MCFHLLKFVYDVHLPFPNHIAEFSHVNILATSFAGFHVKQGIASFKIDEKLAFGQKVILYHWFKLEYRGASE